MVNLRCGIVGLPNVGKSTLFNALTASGVGAQNFPFCTIDPNIGVVEIRDNRLQVLSDISGSSKIIPASTQFVDIAGLVAGASKGEGLGNKFLANIRETDAICHVVRCFEDDEVVHVAGGVDPISDIEVINLELALADLQTIEKQLVKVEKQAKASKELRPTVVLLERVRNHLDSGKPVRAMELSPEDRELLRPFHLLTDKKMLYLCNVSEDCLPELENELTAKVREYAKAEGSDVVTICAKVEEEISQLDEDERAEFLADLGLEQSGLERLVAKTFELLGLITFLTTGEQETRAWTIRKGMSAPEAAGRIHTDIQRGFIRAEVVAYDDMVTYKGRVGAREAGRARSEGKEYIVADGDVILFMHN